MRILVIGDLHGNMPKIYYMDFDVIIAPGDFCSDAPRKYMFEAMRKNIQNKNNNVKWYDLCGKKKAKEMINKSLRDGREILRYLDSLNVPVFSLPGNWDWTGRDYEWKFADENFWKSRLIKSLKNVRDVHKKSLSFRDLSIIGHGISSGPEYPIGERAKRMDKKEISKKKGEYRKLYSTMDKKFKKIRKNKKPILFMSHNVPYMTRLDKIDNKSSPMHGKHMGSYLAKELIKSHQPLLCIGGHMHETFGKTRVGKTICVNAGFGSFVNTLIEIDKGKIKKIEFKRGGKVVGF